MEESGSGLWPGNTGGSKRSVVFTYALWIQHALIGRPIAPVPDLQWQDAAGRRLLTPAEKAARCQYFDRKAQTGLAMRQ